MIHLRQDLSGITRECNKKFNRQRCDVTKFKTDVVQLPACKQQFPMSFLNASYIHTPQQSRTEAPLYVFTEPPHTMRVRRQSTERKTIFM